MDHATRLGEHIVAWAGQPVARSGDLPAPGPERRALLKNCVGHEQAGSGRYLRMLPLVQGGRKLTADQGLAKEEGEHMGASQNGAGF